VKNNKRKIGFVIGGLTSGGAERVISTLSNDLIEKFEITIITLTKSKPFYPLDERIKVISCSDKSKKPKSFLESVQLNYKLARQISKITKEEKIEVLIGFITSANVLTVIASKITGIPAIISERNNPKVEYVPKFWRVLRHFLYPRANTLVLQTKGVKALYEKRISPKKLVILPNPISRELTALKKDLEQKNREKIILTVGRLHFQKRQDMIIRAFAKLNTKGWKLLIVGYGEERKELEDLIEQNKLTDKIEIISKVKNIHEYYNKSSIFVLSSRNEGFPNALLEAMHFGLATISTDCEFGPADIIENGENGFLIDVDGREELIDRLAELMDDETLRQKFSRNAVESTRKYVAKNVVNQWEQLIKSHL